MLFPPFDGDAILAGTDPGYQDGLVENGIHDVAVAPFFYICFN